MSTKTYEPKTITDKRPTIHFIFYPPNSNPKAWGSLMHMHEFGLQLVIRNFVSPI